MRFAHFRDDLIRLVQCLEVIGGEKSMAGVRERANLEHFLGIFTSLSNMTGFVQEFVVLMCCCLVERCDQLALQLIFDVVDKKVHDRFRCRVLNVLTNDSKVRANQFL